jgi:hypothetical protein
MQYWYHPIGSGASIVTIYCIEIYNVPIYYFNPTRKYEILQKAKFCIKT